jgi:hypothetical protein
MGDSGGKTTKATGFRTNIAEVQLPAWYNTALQDFQNSALGIYNQKRATPPPSMYVGLDPATSRALSMTEATAGGQYGSQVPRSALAEWQKTLSGGYADPAANPWLRAVADRAGLETEGRVNAAYATGGAAGGGAYANALADALTQERTQLYAQNYDAERQRQIAALGLTPLMEQMQYADAARLGSVGARREEDALAKATEENRQYMADWDALGRYQDALFGNPAQRAITATESGTSQERTDQSNKFDWAAFLGGLF